MDFVVDMTIELGTEAELSYTVHGVDVDLTGVRYTGSVNLTAVVRVTGSVS